MTLRADLLAIASFYDIKVPDEIATGSFLGLCDFLFIRVPREQARYDSTPSDSETTDPDKAGF